MRLGKRERQALRVKVAARRVAAAKSREPQGRYASMWGRFFPCVRPVGKPSKSWDWNSKGHKKAPCLVVKTA